MFTPPNVSDTHRAIIDAYNKGWIAAMNGRGMNNPHIDPKLRQAWGDGYKNSKHEASNG